MRLHTRKNVCTHAHARAHMRSHKHVCTCTAPPGTCRPLLSAAHTSCTPCFCHGLQQGHGEHTHAHTHTRTNMHAHVYASAGHALALARSCIPAARPTPTWPTLRSWWLWSCTTCAPSSRPAALSGSRCVCTPCLHMCWRGGAACKCALSSALRAFWMRYKSRLCTLRLFFCWRGGAACKRSVSCPEGCQGEPADH